MYKKTKINFIKINLKIKIFQEKKCNLKKTCGSKEYATSLLEFNVT